MPSGVRVGDADENPGQEPRSPIGGEDVVFSRNLNEDLWASKGDQIATQRTLVWLCCVDYGEHVKSWYQQRIPHVQALGRHDHMQAGKQAGCS